MGSVFFVLVCVVWYVFCGFFDVVSVDVFC